MVWFRFWSLLLVSVLTFSFESAYPQTPKKLILGLASIGGGIDTLYVTKKIGAFKRNGLDVDLVLFQGGTQALQALLSGNVLVATYTPTMPYSLYVNSRIKSAKDLKGGKVAVSRFGSSSDFATRFMLKGMGLDPAKDVTIMQIGNQQGRFTALMSGAVDGAVIDIPNTLLAKRQGFFQLADASALGLVYPHNNIATSDAFIREEPETVRNFLRAYVEGIAYYKTHKSESVQMIKEFLRLKDDGIAEESYEYFARLTPAKPYPSVEGVRTVLAEMSATDPEMKGARPEMFVDASFMKSLDESGFIDKLYRKN